MVGLLNSAQVDKLALKVVESTRSTERAAQYFVEPAAGTLDKATSRRHHIVFGRRGSGKTSLLRRASDELARARRPIAFVDLETYKGHSYPDVLLSVLISALGEFRGYIKHVGLDGTDRKYFWRVFRDKKPSRPPFDRRESESLVRRIEVAVAELREQLHSAEHSEVTTRDREGTSSSKEGAVSVGGGVGTMSGSVRGASAVGKTQDREVQRKYTAAKIDFLHRHIIDYQALFRDLERLATSDAFLFFDDLYHIPRADQAAVIDYFHRIAKGGGSKLWLKVGTIRHRTRWYVHGDPTIGLKIGEDADEINLDISLEKYRLAKDFLLRVLAQFAEEVELKPDDILTEGAQDRLLLASGGVARDFLSIFRLSIDVARERGHGKIGAEDVNMAAGDYDTYKRTEFMKDTSDDSQILDSVFKWIRNFCLDYTNTNCFLVNHNATGRICGAIDELVDLKLLHLVRSRVTVPKKRGLVYRGYMLDLCQYTGARKKRGLMVIEFWKGDVGSRSLRKAKLIYHEAGGEFWVPPEVDTPKKRTPSKVGNPDDAVVDSGNPGDTEGPPPHPPA